MTTLTEGMTASDFALWRAYYATLPDRTEYYLSQICELICAAAGIKTKDGRLLRRQDFAPDLRTTQERLEAERRWAQDQAEFEAMRERARKAVANGSAN